MRKSSQPATKVLVMTDFIKFVLHANEHKAEDLTVVTRDAPARYMDLHTLLTFISKDTPAFVVHTKAWAPQRKGRMKIKLVLPKASSFAYRQKSTVGGQWAWIDTGLDEDAERAREYMSRHNQIPILVQRHWPPHSPPFLTLTPPDKPYIP